jgi:hypothetical protein
MFDLFKKVIENGLISLLEKDPKKAPIKNSQIKLQELEIAQKRAMEIQQEYKESNLDPKKVEETRLRILEETKRRLEKEERRLKQIQDKAKAKKEAALNAAKEEKEKFEQFQKMLISLYFNASNDCIKINHFKDYIELIQLNQDKVIEIDHKYIRDFLRVSKILEDNYKKIIGYLKDINNSEYFYDLSLIQIDLDKDIKIYQSTLALGLTMLSALISKNLIVFYGIYEQFDSNGIFDTHHEMKIQQTLSQINENINSLGTKIEKITVAVYEMGYFNGDQLNSLSNVISRELTRVNSNISYPRLIENLAPLAPAAGLVAGYQLGYSWTGPSKK